MAFTRKTEVRHISQPDLIKLAEILNQPSTSPAWKKLMQIVPYELTHKEQLNDGRPKYNVQDIRSIEKAAADNRLNNAAQIFLEEWITSGKIRPTLSHLLQLLVKSESFRAADYVAIDLLSEAPPRRPERGPAAKIDISLPDEHNGIDDELLNGNYPNTSQIMNLNRFHESASKNVARKQIFDRSSLPDRPISEQDLLASLRLAENGAAATPAQTTTGPDRLGSQIQVPHVNGLPSSQHRTDNHANRSTTANESVTTSRTTNESVARLSALTTSRPHNFVPHSEYFVGRNDSDLQQNSGDIPNLSVFNVGTNHQRDNDSGTIEPRMNSTGEEKCWTGNVTQHNNQTVKPAERTITHNFVPNFFSTNESSGDSTALHTQRSDANIPNLSTLNITDGNGNSNNDLNATERTDSLIENRPLLSQLLSSTSVNRATGLNSNDQQDSSDGNVPDLSHLLDRPQRTSDNPAPELNSNDEHSFDGTVPHLSRLLDQSQPTSVNSVPELNSNDERIQTDSTNESFGGNVPQFSQLLN